MRSLAFLAVAAITFFGLASIAQADDFRIGITAPSPLSSQEVTDLGISIQRYDVRWQGESSYRDNLSLTPNVTAIVAVYGKARYAPLDAASRSRYCGFIRSILVRYPEVRGIVVWNEPSQYSHYFWPEAVAPGYYGQILAACAPIIHSLGALVIGPGMHPMVPAAAGRELIEGIAAVGPGVLDVFDLHVYWADIAAEVDLVRSIIGPVTIWVTEDGAQTRPPPEFAGLYTGVPDSGWDGGLSESGQSVWDKRAMNTAYCTRGVEAWFNFLNQDMVDLAAWQSGLERPDGSRKPAYYAVAAESETIRSGQEACAASPPSDVSPTQPVRRPKVTARGHRLSSAGFLCRTALKKWCGTANHSRTRFKAVRRVLERFHHSASIPKWDVK